MTEHRASAHSRCARRAAPTFGWSHTRQRTLDACARRYYWAYYAGHNGWERGAPAPARLAWTLKHLTTYALALGATLHEQAQRVARAARDGHPPPTYHALRASAAAALNALYTRSNDRAAFLAAPARHAITVDAYYGRRPASALFERLRDKLGRCLANLLDQPLWDELAGLPAGAVHAVDAMATVPVDGVPVYAVPDLVFRALPTRWVVVDWKSGEDDGAAAQLAVYALALRDGLGLDACEYEGRVVRLDTGRTEVVQLMSDDLDAARRRLHAGVT